MNTRTTLLTCVWALLCATSTGCRPDDDADDAAPSLTVAGALGAAPGEGFARATEAPELQFPRDHGPHPAFRTEWWYVTANVDARSGRRFGVQLVFFRQALAADTPARDASLAARDLIFAHAAVTDVDGGRFHHAERIARADGELAFARGATGAAEPLRIRCVDWSATATAAPGSVDSNAALGLPDRRLDGLVPLRLVAGDGRAFAFVLDVQRPFPTLHRDGLRKPLVLQGDRGLSQKSAEPGNASIYYSLTRLPIAGTITVDGEPHDVDGLAWIDREWSTSALGADQVGWDWFSLQLDDGTEVMWYRLRRADGSSDPWSRGCLVARDGASTKLEPANVTAEPLGEWSAPDGRACYPARWRLRCTEPAFDLEVTPLLADQELHTLVRYWEGAVGVRGTRAGAPVQGRGYLEMTGYAR